MTRRAGSAGPYDETHEFLSTPHQCVSSADEDRKLIVAERGPLLFVFNFHPTETYTGLEAGAVTRLLFGSTSALSMG